MKKFIASLVIAAVFMPSLSYAGPFGLNVGDDLSKLDIAEDLQDGDYQLRSVPKPHPSFEVYGVVVTPETGLCRIKALSKHFENDASGTQVRAAYKDLLTQLTSVYGRSESHDSIDSSAIWKESNEWVMSVFQNERKLHDFWVSELGFKGKDGVRSLWMEVTAYSRTSSSIILTYELENYPACSQVIEQKNQSAL